MPKLLCEWRHSIKKDGSIGKRLVEVCYWYTPLNSCDICGFTSTPKKVCCRNDCYAPDFFTDTPLLCTGCWNKTKSIIKHIVSISRAKKLINQLRRNANEASNNRTS